MKPSKRSLIRDVALGLVTCVLFFGLLEGLLRIAGWPAPDLSADPFSGFSEFKPLFTVRDGIASTAKHKIRLFNHESFPVIKGPTTYRVFTLGGSTTFGEPYDGRASFSRWLQDLLAASCPEKRFEVINAGGLSYASYRIVPLIKEILTLKPDLIIVYTGHNEFLERRTYSGLFDQGRLLIAMRSFVEELKVYQALKKLLLPALKAVMTGQRHNESSSSQTGPHAEREGGSDLQGEVETILDEGVVGPDAYQRDEAFSKMVAEHFGHHLHAMIRLCKEAGVPIIFVDPSSNLKDCPPFKSEHTQDLSPEAMDALRKRKESACQEMTGGKYEESLKLVTDCIGVAPLFAEYHFLEGQALLGLGRNSEALASFVRARDLDVCPLRCTSPLRDQLVKATSEERVLLVPFHEIVLKRAQAAGGKTGVPGNESFLDHVHPTLEMHQTLAELFLEGMVARGLVTPTKKLTPDDRSALYAKGVTAFDVEYVAMKDLRLGRLLFWAGQREAARVPLERAAGKLRRPDAVELVARLLMQVGSTEAAVREYERALQFDGADPYVQLSLVSAYLDAGQKSKAIELCEKLAAIESGVPEAKAYLAMLYQEEGRAEEGLKLAEEGLRKHPDNASLLAAKSLTIAELGESAVAFDIMMQAVKIDGNNVRNLPVLARIFARKGKKDDADRCLRAAAEMSYPPEEKTSFTTESQRTQSGQDEAD